MFILNIPAIFCPPSPFIHRPPCTVAAALPLLSILPAFILSLVCSFLAVRSRLLVPENTRKWSVWPWPRRVLPETSDSLKSKETRETTQTSCLEYEVDCRLEKTGTGRDTVRVHESTPLLKAASSNEYVSEPPLLVALSYTLLPFFSSVAWSTIAVRRYRKLVSMYPKLSGSGSRTSTSRTTNMLLSQPTQTFLPQALRFSSPYPRTPIPPARLPPPSPLPPLLLALTHLIAFLLFLSSRSLALTPTLRLRLLAIYGLLFLGGAVLLAAEAYAVKFENAWLDNSTMAAQVLDVFVLAWLLGVASVDKGSATAAPELGGDHLKYVSFSCSISADIIQSGF